MRKKLKQTKGITLVALIITIIVLLILAVVAIRAVTGDGIINHAKNAKADYETRAEEENAILSSLTDYIKDQTEGTPSTVDEEVTPTYDKGWKIYEYFDSKNGAGPAWIIVAEDNLIAGGTSYTNGTGEKTDGVYVLDMKYMIISSIDEDYIIFGEYSETSQHYVRYKFKQNLSDQEVQLNLGS